MNNSDERDYAMEITLLRVEIQRHPDGTIALVVRDAEPETIGDVNALAFPAVIGSMPNASSLADARDKALNALNNITGPQEVVV